MLNVKACISDHERSIARPSVNLGFEILAGSFKRGHPLIELDIHKSCPIRRGRRPRRLQGPE
jgi:hypothetical protein